MSHSQLIKVTDKGFYMDSNLKSALTTVCYNLQHDWDFVFIVSGDGLVRVGKTIMAQSLAYFVSYTLMKPFSEANVVFSGDELMSVAKQLPKNSAIIYDEARGELDSKKTLEKVSKVLQDFFAECGYMNHFIVLVLPDFFEMNKYIAVNRSDALINVFRTSEPRTTKQFGEVLRYKRGYFEFYNRNRKRDLYIEGKKLNNSYAVGRKNFGGTFENKWMIDEQTYMKKKAQYVQRDRFQIKESDMINQLKFLAMWKIASRVIPVAVLVREMTNWGFKITTQEANTLQKNFQRWVATHDKSALIENQSILQPMERQLDILGVAKKVQSLKGSYANRAVLPMIEVKDVEKEWSWKKKEKYAMLKEEVETK